MQTALQSGRASIVALWIRFLKAADFGQSQGRRKNTLSTFLCSPVRIGSLSRVCFITRLTIGPGYQWTDPRIAGARNYTGAKWRPAILGSMDSSQKLIATSSPHHWDTAASRSSVRVAQVSEQGRSFGLWDHNCPTACTNRWRSVSGRLLSWIHSPPSWLIRPWKAAAHRPHSPS